MSKNEKLPLLLVVLDGWGWKEGGKGNAILKARTQNMDAYWDKYPHSILKASGNAVGLPEGTIGNSEVGHLHLGAGRIVWQPLELINREIKNGGFYKNRELLGAVAHAKAHNSDLNLMGLCSDAGVHAHLAHLYALLELAKREKIERVFLHCFLDGRDVGEKSAGKYLEEIREKLKKYPFAKIATLIGRFYAMDRDKNWERTQTAYDLLVEGKGAKKKDAREALEFAYAQGDATDYYVRPLALTENGELVKCIGENDSIVFFNFRSDRARQVSAAFVDPSFGHFPVKKLAPFFAGLSEYDARLKMHVAFPQSQVKENLGKVLARNGLGQLRVAETEKYAHVTYFFNSQVEVPEKGEERILVPSSKVPSYDLKPEMSAEGITDVVLKTLEEKKYDFMLVNFANPDLVGHSGKEEAVVKGIEEVDGCLGRIVEKTLALGGKLLVTADHGNAEEMEYEDGSPKPSHTTNPVPCILISGERGFRLKPGGQLIDVAPTLLELLGLEKPREMEGESLVGEKEEG